MKNPLKPFKLQKLTIEAYEDVERFVRAGAVFRAMYNPESFSLEHTIQHTPNRGLNTTGGANKYLYTPPSTLNLTLIIDGSGVHEFGLATAWRKLRRQNIVDEQIDLFLDLCYNVNGRTHEPKYLRLIWGEGPLKKYNCRLKSVKVNYTSFARDGSPLRAELQANFFELEDVAVRKRRDRFSSPDLTHRRVVKAGDTLPLLTREVYGSASHYLRVAQFNGLDDFRQLTPGQTLIFPPLASEPTATGDEATR
ncbi:MAG: hypothetical protein KDE09_07730 [Anaerolineales bacterium]|nr:hypothetical protein [Anaerolineales bacterium]MCB0017664.1 hypothetical protein [Anaerolineales bacterium]MCB0031535.1 hypothetical protein [Anaerolineales bacterium]MCB8963005.1 hypothetical protein [Ardenticatenales bacterium]